MSEKEQGKAEETQPEEGSETSKAGRGVFGIEFPVEQAVWQEARRMVTDKNTRVADLSICAAQDPVIVIELLRISNAMYFAGGKANITTVRTAIVRLGSDVMLSTLERLAERPQFDDEDISRWFEVHRSKGKRTAIVARLLSEPVARTLADDCQTAGLMSGIGEMLAVAHLGHTYVDLAEELARNSVNYRLVQDHKFDVENMGLNYLRRSGIPEAVLFAIDREARSRTPDRAIMKPICMAAREMVESFDANRWEKLAPGKTIPPKSAIRMLQMSDSQYLRVYERASEYLFSVRLAEERRKQNAIRQAQEALKMPGGDDSISIGSSSSGIDEELENEISNLLHPQAELIEEAEYLEQEPAGLSELPETQIHTVPEDLGSPQDQFSLKTAKQREKKEPRAAAPVTPITPPKLRTGKGTQIVSSIASAMDEADTSEDLLSDLLARLVDNGPFEKSALIVVSQSRKDAIVVAARGPRIGNGQRLALDDPLSPLAQCFSKVQSFGNKESHHSPFGSKSFALAPIDADHETPVALYADCGNDGSLTFEARRIFRTVVDILNQKLPSIPGGIPVELDT